MEPILFEAMRVFQWPLGTKKPSFKIRLWIKLQNWDDDTREFEERFINFLYNIRIAYPNALTKDIAEKFSEEINAVEITRTDNMNGVIAYLNWP